MATEALPIVRGQPPKRRTGLRQARRISQILTLLVWVALFLLTRDQVTSAVPPDLFLLTDPLLAAITMGAAQLFVASMLFALVLVAVTLVFGRIFCGWLCPLGTLLDLVAKVLGPPQQRFSPSTHQWMQSWKYYLLGIMVLGAFFSAQWIYLLDPLVLLFRGVATGIYPALAWLLPQGALGQKLGVTYYAFGFAPVALLLVVLGLTAITPRFYCRYLCPLGAFYGTLSRVAFLRRRVKGCDACKDREIAKQCLSDCRMGAVPQNPHRTQSHECIRCFTGRATCHGESIRFDWEPPRAGKQDAPLSLSRRSFLVAGAGGAALAPLATLSAYHRGDAKSVVRPPMVLDEETFHDQCVRCAMCVQACPSQTLQLTHLEAGVAGFWTPAITPSVGGCIAECNDCSVVCPTDAIPNFEKHEAAKWAVKMGTAVLETNRCISYTEMKACNKCVEICPTKAFVVQSETEDRPRRPVFVDYVRCVGCGLCETACGKIVFGTPALLTFAKGRGQPTTLAHQPTESYEVPIEK